MGKMVLPSISKIEDVLDLLTNPAKYIQYMQEFKTVYDEAHNALGDLHTKEAADAYLSSAADAHDAAIKYTENAKKSVAEMYAEHTAKVNKVNIDLDVRESFVSEKEKRHEKCSEEFKELQEAFHKNVETVSAELQRQLNEVDRKSVKLDSELSLVAERKAKAVEAMRSFSEDFK